MENAQTKHKLLSQVAAGRPLTKQQYDAIQRRRVERRRQLEDISLQKRLKSV